MWTTFGKITPGVLPDKDVAVLNKALTMLEHLINRIAEVAPPLEIADYAMRINEEIISDIVNINIFGSSGFSGLDQGVQCPAPVTHKVVDRVVTDGCNVVVRTRDVSYPCGEIVGTSIRSWPVCHPSVSSELVAIQIIGGDVYHLYQDYSYPSHQKYGDPYCVINPAVNCSRSSGSYTACLAGCYVLLINAPDSGVCNDCGNISQLITLTDNGDCTLLANVELCGVERTIKVYDDGPRIAVDITDQSSGDLLARYVVDDVDFDPTGITILSKELGNAMCDWGQVALFEPCRSSSSHTSGSGGPPNPGDCMCWGPPTGDFYDTTVNTWALDFSGVVGLECNCLALACRYCLKCSRDAAQSPGNIYIGPSGEDMYLDNGKACTSACLWSDRIVGRARGKAFDDCDGGSEEYVVVLRGGTSLFELTVENKDDPTDVVVRYANISPADCRLDYIMYLESQDEASCTSWPLYIVLTPSTECGTATAACSDVCIALTSITLPTGFSGILGELAIPDWSPDAPTGSGSTRTTPCPSPDTTCADVLDREICLSGDGCTWAATIAIAPHLFPADGQCSVPDVTVTIEDKGAVWKMKVTQPAPIRYPAIPASTLTLAQYECVIPPGFVCGDDLIFTLVSVDQVPGSNLQYINEFTSLSYPSRCYNWPCTVLARPPLPLACCPSLTPCEVITRLSILQAVITADATLCPCLNTTTTLSLTENSPTQLRWVSEDIPCGDHVITVMITCTAVSASCNDFAVELLCDHILSISGSFTVDSCSCDPFSLSVSGQTLNSDCGPGNYPDARCIVGSTVSMVITEL